MIRYLPVAAALLMLGSAPCRAEADVPYGPATTVEVLGHTYNVKTFDMTGTGLSWSDVKDSLPKEIHEAPAAPIDDNEVLVQVQQMRAQYQAAYENCVSGLASSYVSDNPDASYDQVELLFSEKFQGGDGTVFSQDCQTLHNAYLAGLYLHDMIREAVTGEPPDF